MLLMVWIPILLLVIVGIVALVRPDWCVDLYIRWNALFGVDLNRVIASRSRLGLSMRIGGIACVVAAGILLFTALKVLGHLG